MSGPRQPDRYQELRTSAHVQRKALRVLDALEYVNGTRFDVLLDEVVNEIATMVLTLEMADVPVAYGGHGMVLTRGPHEGYTVHVAATEINQMHLGLESALRAEARDELRERYFGPPPPESPPEEPAG